ncbi:MAG: antibiotic transport system permease protein [Rubritepida sp.]|nr:antibiotic transport system permease protein [Rubritepida sp.]
MSGVLAVFRGEFRRIFALKPVFATLVLAVAIYAVFYPQPYLNEALRDVPIAVVDADNTLSSREMARRIDATPDIAVALVLPDLPSAEREVQARSIHGILVIPREFERDLLHGRSAPVALYADAGYFLMYQRLSGGVTAVARTFGAEVEATRLVALGVDPALALAAGDPMPLTAVALFNPQGGYATYVLPAALVLILQQTLLIGVGLLGTLPGARVAEASPVATVLGKLLAYLTLETAAVLLYLVVLPFSYGIPRLGPLWAILFVALPFVLAVAGLGLVVAAVFHRPLVVQLVFAAVGLPFFFLAGFAWPTESIPGAVHWIAQLVPSTTAIDALVRVSQLGAPLPLVRDQILVLWGLVAFYGTLAVLLEARRAERPILASP